MKKIIAFSLMLVLMTTLVLAGAHNMQERNNKGNAQHLYLYEKNPSNWLIVEDGAWGKMMYKDDSFVFSGHGLVVGEEYTLLSYREPWAGCNSTILGSAESNDEGNVHIMGVMPELVVNDYSEFTTGDYQEGEGSKIWLVPSSDFPVDEGCFSSWNPTEYLFENNLI